MCQAVSEMVMSNVFRCISGRVASTCFCMKVIVSRRHLRCEPYGILLCQYLMPLKYFVEFYLPSPAFLPIPLHFCLSLSFCFIKINFGACHVKMTACHVYMTKLVMFQLQACHAKKNFIKKLPYSSSSFRDCACNVAKIGAIFRKNTALSCVATSHFEPQMLRKNRTETSRFSSDVLVPQYGLLPTTSVCHAHSAGGVR
ncbi:hypothetical protein PSELUDRAFT_1002 [Vogesella sp. LIG4]|nr:hypothetical protein PSELUDRAFT_1002 [Vogesella sp. LIG4]